MTAKRILVPTDFSEFSVAALEQASMLAREHDASLLIVYVNALTEDTTSAGVGTPSLAFDREYLAEEMRYFAPQDPAVEYSQHIVVGEPVTEIVAFSETRQVDMIVMGTHGRSGLGNLLIGSVAEGVVRHASCPVLTVRSAREVVA
ncbi:MAG TPA: universal stress protein [Planctomycetaceae bacterium]|nr:universal stress protein UspA [Blastopirellula sp.]HAY79285.1 universal stress protein [Planctomycetaceae bacterium]